MTNTVVKASETAVYAGQKIGVPEKLIRDAGEAEALQQQALEQTTEVSPEQANAQQLG